ncbi:uncharacterized protein SCHCODRAFT_02481850 [Schizophyllum commune H4-8]|uniref:Srp40 C-terminal domain-containing protein n=1 Tax=Schizophyllum commune (strain H4-8 / FGSC 9210) TaxID=578458 RepID=D8PV60_SCHCM|nr:uncharacterized protein SCHCODRAFT_02481850 [Schizophyllum commune H4-8]KAI5900482.1 hypothetical protein SCHCODRAFT_02481850 [Schizophyllum commune H4-8]
MSDYGARAHQDLIVTRGAGFRKEKNKKKRGSYRGGDITASGGERRCTIRTLTRLIDGVPQHQVHLSNTEAHTNDGDGRSW